MTIQFPGELIEKIMSFSNYEDCLNFMALNKEWGLIAEKTAKEKLISLFRKSIEEKAIGFYKLTSKNIEAYCPSYVVKLNHIQKNLSSLSLREIQGQLSSMTEKYHVHIAEIGTFDLPEAEVIGNQFIRFNYTTPEEKKIVPWSEIPGMSIPEVKCYFPLKMFNEKRESVSFPLYGRLIELFRNFSLDQMTNAGKIYYPEAIYHPSTDASGPMVPWKEKLLEKLVRPSSN